MAIVGSVEVRVFEGPAYAAPERHRSRPGFVALLGLVLAMGAAGEARAAGTGSGSSYARIRHVDAASTVAPSAPGATDQVSPNRPIPPGSRLENSAARVEIALADTSLIWIDRGSVVEFTSLADRRDRRERTNQLTLRRGRLRIDTTRRAQPDAVFRIDTEAGSILLLSTGSFRIEARSGVTSLASFSGVAEFSGDAGSVLVRGGESCTVPVGGAPTTPRRFNSSRRDDFDGYHDARLAAYADPGGTEGAFGGVPAGLPDEIDADGHELAFYGTWHTLPPYGIVWRPHTPAGWAPYVNGSWRWYSAGWVWISAEPWGWTPYHYGRWDYSPGLGWFWIPGTVWSGAWVAFAAGPAQIGWCPLNYWNQPVFRDPLNGAPATVAAARLDARAWRFVAIEQFGEQPGSTAGARGRRPQANTSLVLTRLLPGFDPSALARLPDGTSELRELVRRTRVPLTASGVGAQSVPFLVEEARARQANDREGEALREAATGRAVKEHQATTSQPPHGTGDGAVASPAPKPPVPQSAPESGRPPGHAVERLVDGARPAPHIRGSAKSPRTPPPNDPPRAPDASERPER